MFSSPASAHEYGNDIVHGGAVAFVVVLALPILAGLIGGVAALHYRSLRAPEDIGPGWSLAISILISGLGAASLLTAVEGHLGLSIIGGTIGAAVTLWLAGNEAIDQTDCGNHAELTAGAISTHRVLEGVVLGTLYSTGAAVGVLGAGILAGHAALETAAVGGLYATVPRRTQVVGAILIVQVSYIAGGVAGVGLAATVPASIHTLVLAIVGGALLLVGMKEVEYTILVDEWMLSG